MDAKAISKARVAIGQAVDAAIRAKVPVDAIVSVMLARSIEAIEQEHGPRAVGAWLCNVGGYALAKAEGDGSPGAAVPVHHCHIAAMRHSLDQLADCCPIADLRDFLRSVLADLAEISDGGRA